MKKILFVMLWLCVSGLLALAQQNNTAGTKPDEKKDQAIVPPIHTEIEVKGQPPIIEENLLTMDFISSSLIARQQMEDLQATDLLTGLRMTPGVLISRYNLVGSYGGGDGGTLFIRGMGSGRPGSEIQFLVDGVPKFSGVWTHPLMDVLSLDSIEQVQVVKGASPVLFGNMAAGAVDIRTRRMEREGWLANLTAGGGSYGTLVTHAEAGYRHGNFDTFAAAGYRTSDGHRAQSAGRLEDFFARLGYTLTPGWHLDATLAHTNNYALDPGPVNALPPSCGKFTIRDWTTVITLENNLKRADGYFRFYRDAGVIRWEQWNTSKNLPEDSDTDYTNWGFRARQTLRPVKRLNLTVGFDGDNYGGSFRNTLGQTVTTKDECRMWNAAPYILAGMDLGEKWKISPFAGLRYNVSRYFGNFAAPEGGVAVSSGQTRFHFSASRGFNLPGVYAVFSYQDWQQGDRWKTLRPEKIIHYEGGVSHTIHNRVKMDLTIFRDKGTAALRFTAPPPHFDNIGEYDTKGVEISVAADPFDTVHTFISCTFLDPEPVQMPYAPRRTAQFGVNWDAHRRMRLSTDAQFVGARWSGNLRYPGQPVLLDNFFLLNTRIRWHISPDGWQEKVFLFAGLENLTNTRYQYRPGYDMPGVVFLGGVRVALGGEK